MKQPSKPYVISEIIFDVDSPAVRVITIKGEKYEYPIVPARKMKKKKKYKVALVYDEGEYVIVSKYYDSIIDKDYNDCIILKHAHEPTHHDMREINPLYIGFCLKRKINREIPPKIREKVTELWLFGKDITNIIEDLFSTRILPKVQLKMIKDSKLKKLQINKNKKKIRKCLLVDKNWINFKIAMNNVYETLKNEYSDLYKWIKNVNSMRLELRKVANTIRNKKKSPTGDEFITKDDIDALTIDLPAFADFKPENRLALMFHVHNIFDEVIKVLTLDINIEEKLIKNVEKNLKELDDPFFRLRLSLEYLRLKLKGDGNNVRITQDIFNNIQTIYNVFEIIAMYKVHKKTTLEIRKTDKGVKIVFKLKK